MKKVVVYDLPTRAFHFIFGLLFIFSFSIGKFVDDDSWLYAYHMLSGLLMVFLIILRVLWGFFGTKYAKFKSFQLHPKKLTDYFRSIVSGKTKRELGHNPASSYAAIIMFIMAFLLVSTGLLMISGIAKEFFEEVHELFAFAFLLTVIFHILGVLFHQIRHQDGMISSMFNGEKDKIGPDDQSVAQAPLAFFIFLVLTLGFASYLLNSFNVQNGTLNLFGKTLQLSEQENEHDLKYYNRYYEINEDD